MSSDELSRQVLPDCHARPTRKIRRVHARGPAGALRRTPSLLALIKTQAAGWSGNRTVPYACVEVTLRMVRQKAGRPISPETGARGNQLRAARHFPGPPQPLHREERNGVDRVHRRDISRGPVEKYGGSPANRYSCSIQLSRFRSDAAGPISDMRIRRARPLAVSRDPGGHRGAARAVRCRVAAVPKVLDREVSIAASGHNP